MHPIVEYRKARGLTQADLARVMGVNVNTVQGWERGAEPRARLVPRLADALGVDSLHLLREIRAWKAARPESARKEASTERAS